MSKSHVMWDPGSFKDPAGSVFFVEGVVYRSIAEDALPMVRELLQTQFFQRHVKERKIIPTTLIDNKFCISGTCILQHEKIPFISYPYEWSFYMLKDAALLTLNLLKECLSGGYILKDGSAWNTTYYQGQMIFFDVLSIDRYEEGQTWNGYQQFCNEFLYPLLIKAHKGIDFHQSYKGSLGGIDSLLTRRLFSYKDILKPGVLKHVLLNVGLGKSKKISSATLKNRFKLPKVALVGIVEDLIRVVSSLECSDRNSVWVDYVHKNTYGDKDEGDKKNFIQNFCEALPVNSQIMDLGCNTGNYSCVASEKHRVISSDIDSSCIDFIYKKISSEGPTSIIPLVFNLMNPSAGVGWGLQEKKSIFERLDTQAFFALALIHHICIAHNVPLERFIELLRKIAPRGVLEWVDKEDPMVQFLLRNRLDIFPTYTWEKFEDIVKKHFIITKVSVVNNGFRKLLWLEKLD